MRRSLFSVVQYVAGARMCLNFFFFFFVWICIFVIMDFYHLVTGKKNWVIVLEILLVMLLL